MKTATHIKTIQLENKTVKERIQCILGWTDLQYAEYQEEMGYRYLVNEFGTDCIMAQQLVYQKVFWSWWINHWMKRDIAFLEAYKKNPSITEVVYRLRHNPKGVEFDINSDLYQKSFAAMIGQLIKEVTNG